MKKTVIYTTAILLIVTALCLSAVTFSFFTSKSSNIEVDIDSITTEALRFTVTPNKDHKLVSGHNAHIVTPSEVGKDVISCDITYSTRQAYATDVYFTVSKFLITNSTTKETIDRTSELQVETSSQNESDYIASLLEYQIIKIEDNPEQQAPPVPIEPTGIWKSEMPFPKLGIQVTDRDRDKYFWLGPLVAQQSGKLKFFMRFKNGTDAELIPGHINDYEIQVVLEARELGPKTTQIN